VGDEFGLPRTSAPFEERRGRASRLGELRKDESMSSRRLTLWVSGMFFSQGEREEEILFLLSRSFLLIRPLRTPIVSVSPTLLPLFALSFFRGIRSSFLLVPLVVRLDISKLLSRSSSQNGDQEELKDRPLLSLSFLLPPYFYPSSFPPEKDVILCLALFALGLEQVSETTSEPRERPSNASTRLRLFSHLSHSSSSPLVTSLSSRGHSLFARLSLHPQLCLFV